MIRRWMRAILSVIVPPANPERIEWRQEMFFQKDEAERATRRLRNTPRLPNAIEAELLRSRQGGHARD